MRILLLADIHIGSIKDTNYVYHVLQDIIDKELIFQKTDLVVILGDYYDRLFKVNEPYTALAINVMSYLVRACRKNKTKLRFIYGTESHEMIQYILFNHYVTSTIDDVKVFQTVSTETIQGKKILYIPEEYVKDQKSHYQKYFSEKYDYVFGHGIIEDGMSTMVSVSNYAMKEKTNEKTVPIFKSVELSPLGKFVVFGHFHSFKQLGNVYYLGSLFRDSFGEEEPKVYGIIQDDQISFVENKEAYTYKTYEFGKDSEVYQSTEVLLKEVEKIKKQHPELFNGKKYGKIRLKFELPKNLPDSFKEAVRNLITNEKQFTVLMKQNLVEIEESMEEDQDQFEYLFESIPVVEKYHRFLMDAYDYPLPMNLIESYIK